MRLIKVFMEKVKESIEQSLKEMKLIREGKMKKQNWRESFKEIKKELLEEDTTK